MLDIALVLDHSSSVGPASWQSLIDFMASFVSALEIGAQETRVAAVSFGKNLHFDTETKCRCLFKQNEIYNKMLWINVHVHLVYSSCTL